VVIALPKLYQIEIDVELLKFP